MGPVTEAFCLKKVKKDATYTYKYGIEGVL